jgi:hypothetical protein
MRLALARISPSGTRARRGWLVEHGFAVARDGRLEATPLGVEVGADLSFSG